MTASNESVNAESSSILAESIAAMTEAGANHFDPVRFRFIESMAGRAKNQRETVSRLIENKALQALNDYKADLEKAKKAAVKIIEQVARKKTESAADLQQLFDASDFNGVKRLAGQKQGAAGQYGQQREYLTELKNLLEHKKIPTSEKSRGVAFDDFMRQQEDVMMQSLTAVVDGQSSREEKDDSIAELKSIRLFRQSRLQRYADDLLNQSIDLKPENPGPLNPQMLSIRSLSHMRDLSPHYLNRFVAYIDTLVWLEQFEEAPKTAKGKKGKK